MEPVTLANGDVQRRYGISRSTVLRWTEAKRLPKPVNPSGKPKGRRYWLKEEIEDYERRWLARADR